MKNTSSPSPRKRALLATLVLAAPLVIGLCMEVSPARATLFGIEGPGCMAAAFLGDIVCLGCGLTRSTALLVQGEWQTATTVHPGGWLVVLFCLAGVLVNTDIARRSYRSPIHRRLQRTGHWAFATGILGIWVARVLTQTPAT